MRSFVLGDMQNLDRFFNKRTKGNNILGLVNLRNLKRNQPSALYEDVI